MVPSSRQELPLSVVEIDVSTLGLLVASGRRLRAYTSLEGENPGGSIKDRMVIGELSELISAGALRPGGWIAEISSGSTARSLAHHCASLGINCALFVPRTLPEADLRRLRESGAEVHAIEVEGAYERFRAFCRERNMPAFDQLFDASKRRHYRTFGRALQDSLGVVDWLIGGVGTGHSLSGVATGMMPRPLVVSAEPAQGSVSGVRNIELQRYGPDDPCIPAWFDHRMLVEPQDFYSGPLLRTDRGGLVFGDSFRLVLGAFKRLAAGRADLDRPLTAFLLGAQNRIDTQS
jgi:cysteine synthase